MLSPPRILVGAISDRNSGTAWNNIHKIFIAIISNNKVPRYYNINKILKENIMHMTDDWIASHGNWLNCNFEGKNLLR